MPLPLALLLATGLGLEGVSAFRKSQAAEQQQANQQTAIGNFVNELDPNQQGIAGSGLELLQAFGSDPNALIQDFVGNQLPPTQQQQFENENTTADNVRADAQQQLDIAKAQEQVRQFERTLQQKALERGDIRNGQEQDLIKAQVELFGKINSIADKVGDDARPTIQAFSELTSKFDILRDSLNSGDGAAAVASLFSFVSFLDPGSVVREGEVALLTSESGLPAELIGSINKALGQGGSLASKKLRTQLAKSVNGIYKSRLKEYEKDLSAFRSRVQATQQSIPQTAAPNVNIEQLSGLEGLLQTPDFNPIAVGEEGGTLQDQIKAEQDRRRGRSN